MKNLNAFNAMIIAILFILILSINNCSFRYPVVVKNKVTKKQEEIKKYVYFFFGSTPEIEVQANSLCSNGKIAEIIVYDTFEDRYMCDIFLFLICPKTIGIICY